MGLQRVLESQAIMGSQSELSPMGSICQSSALAAQDCEALRCLPTSCGSEIAWHSTCLSFLGSIGDSTRSYRVCGEL